VPAFFVKAGGMANFSDRCQKLLAEVGYENDDFGPHEQVQAKIGAAKAKCAEYDRYVKEEAKGKWPAGKKPPDAPTSRDRMLSQCQSGHLTQDALFRAPSERGNACANNAPPEGDGRCYDTDAAPCMPMITYGGTKSRPRNSIGSPHWAVGQNESDFAAENKGQAIDPNDMSAQCKRNAEVVTGQGDGKDDYDDHMASGFRGTQKVSAETKRKEAQRRRDNAASLQQNAAAELAAKGGGGAGPAADAPDDEKTAADCIEKFRKAAMEQMRRDAIAKYGTNYQKTKTEARAAQATASANAAAAKKRAEDATKAVEDGKKDGLSKEEMRRLNKEKWESINASRKADREKETADRKMKNVNCMHQQACSLAGVPRDASPAEKDKAFAAAANGPLPPPQGFVH
jgi:hypothetical protein